MHSCPARWCQTHSRDDLVLGYRGRVLILLVKLIFNTSSMHRHSRLYKGIPTHVGQGWYHMWTLGQHGFVYLICGNTGDTAGKIGWMKGIHLLPLCTHRHNMPTLTLKPTHACVHMYICSCTQRQDGRRLLRCKKTSCNSGSEELQRTIPRGLPPLQAFCSNAYWTWVNMFNVSHICCGLLRNEIMQIKIPTFN